MNELTGNQKNAASDIGNRHPDGSRLWLEAKTVFLNHDRLLQQLQTQAYALRRVAREKLTGIVALIPGKQSEPHFPFIQWAHVAEALAERRRLLEVRNNPSRDMDGYLLLAGWLKNRILTHPKGIVD